MNKDWRTDNWGGHYPVVSDPRNYTFARHLREFNYGATYNFDDGMIISEEQNPIKLILVCLLFVVILSNLGIIIDVLSNIAFYYDSWVESYNELVLILLK